MKKIGIWLDKEKANIVTLKDEMEKFLTINSDIEYYNVKANKTAGGASEVVKDRKFLEREKHQTKSYFKLIASKIKDVNALVIFGPAQMREKFKKELDENYSHISAKVKGVIKVNKMTNNQIKALVRDFFKTN